MPKIQEAQKRAEAKREKLRQQLIFWTNFSRVFLKWGMNILYILLVIGLLWGVYELAIPVFECICWLAGGIWWALTSNGFVWFLQTILECIVVAGLVVGRTLRIVGVGLVLSTKLSVEKPRPGVALRLTTTLHYYAAVPLVLVGDDPHRRVRSGVL